MVDTKLDSYLASYTSFNDWLIDRRYQHLRQYFHGKSCLEMGIAEGTGLQYLLEHFDRVTIVDGSAEAVKEVSHKYANPKLTAVHSYFENMDFGDQKFDTILMAHILEHVDDPVVVLEQAKKFLAPGGVMIVDVPNGNSLHRQVGVKMGLLKVRTELNEADLSIGHQRVYLPDTFQADIKKAGLTIDRFGGMFVKILSNAQSEKTFNNEQLEALFLIGEENAEIAAEIYVIAKV